MNRIVRYLAQTRTQVVRRHNDEVFKDGFDEAASICVTVVTAPIDGLLDRMKSDTLDDKEQKLFAELTDLRLEMERQLFSHWSDPQ